MDQIAQLQKQINESSRIVFFGGAGVSTESGIPDFRSVDGLYHQSYQYPPETILSGSFFFQQTEEFFRFYRAKMLCLDAKPNAAHKKLAELEAAGKLTAVVTQNIDGLHQAAGSKCVYELHGSVHRNYCLKCGKFFDVKTIEESLDGATLTGATAAIAQADLLIIGGTSLAVYPAAGLVQYCRGKITVINKTPTQMDGNADLLINSPIGEIFSQISC